MPRTADAVEAALAGGEFMYLVQFLVPVRNGNGSPVQRAEFARIASVLTERFGGMTAFTRAPAEGLWTGDGETAAKDDVVLFEVMAAELDRDWWRRFRKDLEARLGQQLILVRAQAVETI